MGRERPELLNLFDIDSALRVKPELRGIVFKGQIVEVVRLDRPIQLVSKILH